MIIDENLTMSEYLQQNKYIQNAEEILKYIAEKTGMMFQPENADHYMRCFARGESSYIFNSRVWYDGEHFKYRCTKDEWDYSFSNEVDSPRYVIDDIKVKDIIERLNLDIKWYRNYLNEKRKENIKKAGEKYVV